MKSVKNMTFKQALTEGGKDVSAISKWVIANPVEASLMIAGTVGAVKAGKAVHRSKTQKPLKGKTPTGADSKEMKQYKQKLMNQRHVERVKKIEGGTKKAMTATASAGIATASKNVFSMDEETLSPVILPGTFKGEM